MKKCLLVINKISGNAAKAINNRDMYNVLEKSYEQIDTMYIEENKPIDIRKEAEGYDALAICGGDGTFNNAINATRLLPQLELIYIPCGTFNDTAKSLQLTSQFKGDSRRIRRVDIGEIDGALFSYVAAAGSFTSIGYKTKTEIKKKFKLFAYFFEVLREYKVHKIKAKISINDRIFEDTYTLIMAINSKRCFGFNFNRLYSHNSGKAHLLLIKAPSGKGLISFIKMFFPFFRAFFIGFDKEIDTKNIKFLEFENGTIELPEKQEFTIDGEKIELFGKFDIKIYQQRIKLFVY